VVEVAKEEVDLKEEISFFTFFFYLNLSKSASTFPFFQILKNLDKNPKLLYFVYKKKQTKSTSAVKDLGLMVQCFEDVCNVGPRKSPFNPSFYSYKNSLLTLRKLFVLLSKSDIF
jgi:hypothetical protein